MSEVWKRWEGQVADHKYYLQQYLGSTDHSAVFLAEFHDPEPRQAAVKFISADLVPAEQQLAAWNRAAQLSHPNLIRIYKAGRCKMEDMDLLYVAMEYAEENLAQVLPNRALTPEETRDMLNAVVDVLVYLHDKRLTHGHVKPSNILALGEVLKLSSDTILPAGEVRQMRREQSAYDASELPNAAYTAAADMWSLGVTLVEALTQQPAVLPYSEQADPVIPMVVRDHFEGIARHTLRREPKLRWTSAQIAELLNPTETVAKVVAAGASAAASVSAAVSAVVGTASVAVPAPVAAAPAPVSPLDVPLSKEPAIPLAKLAQAPTAHPPILSPRARSAQKPPKQTVVLPNYVIPLFAAVLIVIALITLPKVLRRRVASESNPSEASTPSAAASVPAAPASSPAKAAESSAKATAPAKAPAPEHVAQTQPQPVTAAPTPEPATMRTTEATPPPTAKSARAATGGGEVLDQVLPQAPEKALATISGTVRVSVKVHVDAAGNVAEAEFENPGPSRYFADLSLKAARGWVFSSPEAEGRSVPSDWLIQFYFTQDGVKAVPQQVTP